jgi:hypothetical protein
MVAIDKVRLQLADRARELTFFNLAIDSKLRGATLSGFTSMMWFTAIGLHPERSRSVASAGKHKEREENATQLNTSASMRVGAQGFSTRG